MNLSNNTILITGGGSGIGLALAKEFLQLNNKVIICGRNADRLQAAKKKLPSLEAIQCDVANEDSVLALLEKIHQKHPDLNFLINNAGVMKLWNVQKETTSTREQKEEVLINLFGTIQLTQLLIPSLLRQKKSFILNVSSALGEVPMPVAPIYSSTKAALHTYSIAIRQQLQNTNISVFELLPAAIATDMAREIEKNIGMTSSNPKMTPEKLEILTIRGLKNDTPEIRPGIANVLHVIHRFFPSLAQKMISSQSKKMLLKL